MPSGRIGSGSEMPKCGVDVAQRLDPQAGYVPGGFNCGASKLMPS